MPAQNQTRVDANFICGIDLGGTKIHILDSKMHTVRHLITKDYKSVYDILDTYFADLSSRPAHVVLAIAGPRDDETGEVCMTHCSWPPFRPIDASERYPGTTFTTTNDMVVAMAGVLTAPSYNLKVLKPGQVVEKGTKITVTISTGVNACVAAWDRYSERYVFLEAEAGQAGFQPRNEAQQAFLRHLQGKPGHTSIELAISGKHGIENWIEHSPELQSASKLPRSLDRARDAGRSVGAVLLEYATEGKGSDRDAARAVLEQFGTMVAHILSDYALLYKSTGGIYVVGSVALALGEYMAEQTSFRSAFIRQGAPDRAAWLEQFFERMPIYLVTDPYIGAAGALSLGRSLSLHAK